MNPKAIQGDLFQIDFKSIGIDPAEIEKIEILRKKDTHLVCRVIYKQRSFILKWAFSTFGNKEILVYELLKGFGVETLPVQTCTGQALLLEDLQSSYDWRLAEEDDMKLSETGDAIAQWYLEFHQAGRIALRNPSIHEALQNPWVASISLPALNQAAKTFNLEGERVWNIVLASFDELKAKYLDCPQTFNYNDFAAENLSLSRSEDLPLRAIVFDYDCFTTGIAFSDVRNVLHSLAGEAAAAFQETYGGLNDEERQLDEPLAMMYGLIIASQRRTRPSWVQPILKSVASGDLYASIDIALKL